jgi:hypothetical protein
MQLLVAVRCILSYVGKHLNVIAVSVVNLLHNVWPVHSRLHTCYVVHRQGR